MSALMISQVEVTDPASFQAYMTKTQEVAASYGAELLFRGRRESVLNGEANAHQLVVVARFPDMAAIDRWHSSNDYQALIPLREKGSNQLMVTYQEV